MSFRVRLALLLVAILVSVQALTWVSVFEVTRRESIRDGERQLGATADAIARQLDDVSDRVANSVQILSLDYALREAIAQHDRATVLSALRNHGRRVGAARMLLMDLDGSITADTDAPDSDRRGVFPFPGLLDTATDHPAAAMVAMDGRAYWMVVVTVNAPQPVAMIAAGIPIDDRFLAGMQKLSPLPKNIELVASTARGPWTVVAHGMPHTPLATALLGNAQTLPAAATLVQSGGREYLALARPFGHSPANTTMAMVIGYSLDDALGPFRAVTTTWIALVAFGLIAGVLGAILIARGVSRPLESLAVASTRIASGDYTPPPSPGSRQDELARLSTAFAQMTAAIREREERIRFQAAHDAATGLPNRNAAEAAIADDLRSEPSGHGALLMVGLARLPDIVKTLGHAIGDGLMREAGRRLQEAAAGRLVARAADNQLLLWLPRAERSEAINRAVALRDRIGQPYHEHDLTLDAAPAIGIALRPEHGRDADALLRHADVALLAALSQEEPLAVYDPATDPHRPDRLALMGELREAIDGNQLELHYQPKLSFASGRIEGVEGLVRWTHPQRGAIAPDDFVPLAERTGNVRRLTRWILATGIAQARRWQDAGSALRVALNLSARDLTDADLPNRVAELLALHRLPVERLMLEVTESAVMGEPEPSIAVLRRLAEQGLEIAIDDFGVGQSSLAYLRRLPVREIKIDKSFVRNLALDRDDQAIVRAIVDLGHRLGFRVTSEGVEDRAALEFLAEVGCDHAQGYFIARPLSLHALTHFLAQREAAAAL